MLSIKRCVFYFWCLIIFDKQNFRANAQRFLLYYIFPYEIPRDNRVNRKKRKRVFLSSTSKLAARRLDEVTRAKLSWAPCVTRVAEKSFLSSLFLSFSSTLADLSIANGFLNVHRDFSFSRKRAFSGSSACRHDFVPFTRKSGPVRPGSPPSSLPSLLSSSSLSSSWPSSYLLFSRDLDRVQTTGVTIAPVSQSTDFYMFRSQVFLFSGLRCPPGLCVRKWVEFSFYKDIVTAGISIPSLFNQLL